MREALIQNNSPEYLKAKAARAIRQPNHAVTHRDLLGSLAASLESEAKGYEQHANGPYTESAAMARKQKVAVLALANEVDALREDKARLDWLEKHDAEIFSDEGYGDGLATWHCTVGHGSVNDRQYICHPAPSIREAVDAAIRAEKP